MAALVSVMLEMARISTDMVAYRAYFTITKLFASFQEVLIEVCGKCRVSDRMEQCSLSCGVATAERNFAHVQNALQHRLNIPRPTLAPMHLSPELALHSESSSNKKNHQGSDAASTFFPNTAFREVSLQAR